MRISCPNCNAEYEVPDQALAAGPRLLRCARCEHRFQASLPGPAAPAESPAVPEPPAPPPPAPAAPPPAPSPPPEPPRLPPLSQDRLADAPTSPSDRFALLGWLATVMLLAGAGYAGFLWRAEIMAAWPPAQRLYALLGLI